MAKPPRIEVRRLETAFDPDSPRYWYRGEPGITAFAYALSSVFPDGERFFIDAVRHYRDRITDPELRRQVQAFCGQEAQHGRVHEQYNAHASAQGFATDEVVKVTQERLRRVRAELPAIGQLATTCALEHFTAMMAEQLLGDPRYTAGIAREHADVWRWHAAEEAEHKAVAFDVYRAVGGTYGRRVAHYLLSTLFFSTGTFASTLYLMAEDGHALDLRAHVELLRFLFVEPGLLRAIAPQWLDYLRPGFHPWDRDDSALVERWKAEQAPASVSTPA